MRKLIYLAFCVMAFSVSTYAANKNNIALDDREASYFALNQFASRYQQATNVNWIITDSYQKASFLLNGKKMSAFFDQSGEYIATTQYIDYAKLPAVGRNRLAKIYKEYAVEDIIRYDLDGTEGEHLYALNGRRSFSTVYFASLSKDSEKIVVKITPDGEISYLKSL